MSDMTKLRIVSDGTPAGTYVETSEGKRVDGITHIEWRLGVDDMRAVATLKFVDAKLDGCFVAMDMDEPL
jgi:hypothetical protein